MANDEKEQGIDIAKDKNRTVRTWVEISHRDLTTIKRSLNYPVRASKRGQKNNSEVLAEFIAKTLKREIQTTAEKLEEVREEFVKKLVSSFSVSVKDEDAEQEGTKAVAGMLIRRVTRERDKARAEVEALKNEVHKDNY